jgi:hypothetical protein
MSAASAKAKPHMLAETAPTVLLCSVAVQLELCGAEIPAVGPRPILASVDPEAAEAIHRNPEVFAVSLQCLTWHLLELEYVDLRAANGFCKRSREGKVKRPFHADRSANLEPEAGKRQFFQTSTASDHSTGTNKSLFPEYNHLKFPASIQSSFSSYIDSAIKDKFSNSNYHAFLIENVKKHFSQSLTVRSWKRYESAWNSFVNFSSSNKIPFEWPIPLKNIRLYASWADSVCKLAPSTSKTYISALSKLHLLSGLEMSSFLTDPWLKNFLKGAENAQVYDRPFPAKKIVISFPILQLLGHAITDSDWSHYSKLLFWSTSLFLFFGSF